MSEMPDMDLDHAKALVTRILNFIIADERRLARFLQLGGFQPEALRETTQSPMFMLSVLDTVAKDERLSSALREQEQIEPEMIEMTRARLAFEVAVEVARQLPDEREAAAVREKVEQQLRVLLQRAEGRQPGSAPREPRRKPN